MTCMHVRCEARIKFRPRPKHVLQGLFHLSAFLGRVNILRALENVDTPFSSYQ